MDLRETRSQPPELLVALQRLLERLLQSGGGLADSTSPTVAVDEDHGLVEFPPAASAALLSATSAQELKAPPHQRVVLAEDSEDLGDFVTELPQVLAVAAGIVGASSHSGAS